ncbi:MAG: alpha-L-fucosidase, partial [Bacteroidota bacterium]
MKNAIILMVFLLSVSTGNGQKNYLDESNKEFAERMEWFLDAKYGMFIHFGLYSQLGGIYEGNDEGRYAEWIQANQQIPKSDYMKLID